MSLIETIIARGSADELPFSVVDGNVSVGRSPILVWFNDRTVLIPMNARGALATPSDYAKLDALIMALTTASIGIQYITSIPDFMNPKARFKEWLSGDLTPASVGINLTAEELAVPTAFASAKAKFEAMFTPPKPVLSTGGIDLIAAFGEADAVKVDEWRNKPGASLTTSLRSKIDRDQQRLNVMRLVKTGATAYRVESAAGHTVNRTNFLRAYNDIIKPVWGRVSPTGEIGTLTQGYVEATEQRRGYASEQLLSVFNNHVTVGCQSMPRAEVERIVSEFAKLGITK